MHILLNSSCIHAIVEILHAQYIVYTLHVYKEHVMTPQHMMLKVM